MGRRKVTKADDLPITANKAVLVNASNKRSDIALFKVIKDYPGHKVGEIISHDRSLSTVKNNINNGFWEEI